MLALINFNIVTRVQFFCILSFQLGTDTWFYAKRCFLSLLENMVRKEVVSFELRRSKLPLISSVKEAIPIEMTLSYKLK